ncbi:oligosaccharide repeat unit polymerase, partial [Pseudoalteromonas sp. SG43-7]|uniref:oligosaccharide repeat unit polymerase n=1 Tax=Pseudoalteromonas sp. SG43-7 TaxID=2760966 RepID=UPI0015FEFF04
MILNPFFLMLFIYFLANTYALINLLRDGGFNAYGRFYSLEVDSILYSYFLQVSFWLLISFFYFLFIKKMHPVKLLGDKYAWFLIVITIMFFVFNLYTGAGKAGSGFSFNSANYFNYLFVALQPDVLFLLLAPFLRSKKLFFVVSATFFISLLSRGWMGSVILIFIVFLIRFYPVRINLKSCVILFFSGSLIVLLLPLLDALKWGMRLGLPITDVFSNLFTRGYFSVFAIVFDSIVDRFQNLKYVSLVFESSSVLRDKLFQGEFGWFYQNGIINSIYCKFSECSPDINIYFAGYLVGDTGLSWNVDVGLSGWAGILGVYSP